MFESYSEIIKIEELCRMLKISKNTAYELIRSGQMPARRIGRIYRIRKIDVINFMEAS
ncbi:MAG: helix-turn-helix domain-containing protein [Lachnospiraceae bacterium]|nr:helix-turn-helix domain-containing protein [Lachnospiraceae bacterium]